MAGMVLDVAAAAVPVTAVVAAQGVAAAVQVGVEAAPVLVLLHVVLLGVAAAVLGVPAAVVRAPLGVEAVLVAAAREGVPKRVRLDAAVAESVVASAALAPTNDKSKSDGAKSGSSDKGVNSSTAAR